MFSAVLDANVLFPVHLRDLLIYANLQGRALYAPVWSDEILAEMGRTLITKAGVSVANVEIVVAGMKRTYPDALRNPPPELIEAMGNDPGDRHVLATAVFARSEVIVSQNARHFPAAALEPYGIEVQGIDEFLTNLFTVSEATMTQVVRHVQSRYKRPPFTLEELLAIYAVHAPGFADAIAQAL